MRRALILALLFGGMGLIQPLGSEGEGSQALLAFGFLILAAQTVGEIAPHLRLPRIVGYMLAGLAFGPSVLGAVTALGVARLTPVSDLAVALIAYLAGAELRWEELKARGTILLKVMSTELALTFVALTAALYFGRGLVPFLRTVPEIEALAVALLFASVAIVHSPAVTMALLTETGAHGPVARTTLGVVLLSDVVVVLLFSIVLAIAGGLAPGAVSGGGAPVPAVAWEIFGAPLVGAVLGGCVAAYLRFVGRDLMFFALLIAFFGVEIARLAGVEVLLTLLVAGFVTENLSKRADAFREAMERSAAPVFVVFFAVSGASVAVHDLWILLPVVVPLALLRLASIFTGSRLGARWAAVRGPEGRTVWMGLISQSGVAIGLAAIVAQAFGGLGGQIRTLLLALIAVNEAAGSIFFRAALARAGEVREEEESPAVTATSTAEAG